MVPNLKRVYRYVITNVPLDKEHDVIDALIPLIQRGIIKTSDIHQMEEDERK